MEFIILVYFLFTIVLQCRVYVMSSSPPFFFFFFFFFKKKKKNLNIYCRQVGRVQIMLVVEMGPPGVMENLFLNFPNLVLADILLGAGVVA